MLLNFYYFKFFFTVVGCVPVHGVFAEKRTQHSHHNNSLLVHLLCDWGTTVSGKPITANLVHEAFGAVKISF